LFDLKSLLTLPLAFEVTEPLVTSSRIAYPAPVNALLAKAISQLKKLPESQQESIAREVLEHIAGGAVGRS
jgi:hypothetical protein